MKKKYKTYLKVNLMSLICLAISFTSVTLAWFVYSGLSTASVDANVKAWYIELEKDGNTVSNNITISLDDIYPGMDTINEIVKIQNKGDSDAQIYYKIKSARILDDPNHNFVVNENDITATHYVEDKLSHDYPFNINISLSKNYILSNDDESIFEVSVSWPLDSGEDENLVDSLWGTNAYRFQQNEEELKEQNPSYQTRPSIELEISVTAEQYMRIDDAIDINYNVGDVVFYDIQNGKACESISQTCIKTYIIDVNNKISNQQVTLLPDPKKTYLTGGYSSVGSLVPSNWEIDSDNLRILTADDILKIISLDILDSFVVGDDISNRIIGNLTYNDRLNNELNDVISKGKYYIFKNNKFDFLSSNSCYWVNNEYDTNNGVAVKKENDNISKIYPESKDTNCNIIPVILANKSDL